MAFGENKMTIDEVHAIILDEIKQLRTEIKSIHTPGTCFAIIELKKDIDKDVEELKREKNDAIIEIKKDIRDITKVDSVKGNQKFYIGIFAAIMFIITYLKDPIIGVLGFK